MSMTSAARVGFVPGLTLVQTLTVTINGLTAEADNWPHFREPTMNAAAADNPDLRGLGAVGLEAVKAG